MMQLIGKDVFKPEKFTKKDKTVKKKAKVKIPSLPEYNGGGVPKFVRNAMENLEKAGYVFSDEMMDLLCSEASMKKVIGMQRNLPFFKIFDPQNPQGHKINGENRYYSRPLTFGTTKVYLCSQIYAIDKVPFTNWYKSLC